VVQRIQAGLRKALNPVNRVGIGRGIGSTTPEVYSDPFGAFVSAEVKRRGEAVKAFGAKLE
jgi:hypothetical protein